MGWFEFDSGGREFILRCRLFTPTPLIMAIVNQSDWKFEFSNSTATDDYFGTSKPPTIFRFKTSTELLKYVADDTEDNFGRFQTCIDLRLKEDPVARAWKDSCTPLKQLKHFSKYRRHEFDLYHNAARARHGGTATRSQLGLVGGLEGEINTSPVIVSAGQVLFHGRADDEITNTAPYPTFISTSLNPIVARHAAVRRAGNNQKYGVPRVYVLTVECDLPVLWGQFGDSVEWELLFPPMLKCEIGNTFQGRNFKLVEARIVGRG